MSELQSALVKASRALDAHFRLADDVKPLRDAIGESLDIEKVLVEQRAQRDALATDVDRLKTEKLAHIAEMAKTKQDADADAVAVRSAAESWAADTRAQADRLLIEAKDAHEEGAKMLATAALEAEAVVSAAEAEAKKIATGKTQEIADLDAAIANRKKELNAAQNEIIEAQDKLALIQREINAVKARLG